MTIYTPFDPIQGAPEWFIAEVVSFKRNRENTAKQLIDNRDPLHPWRTVCDSTSVVATKHFLILLGLPLYTLGVMGTHVIRCFTLVGTNLLKGCPSESFFSLIQEVWAVAKAPIFSCALFLCAISGLAFPLVMRSAVAKVEQVWSGSERDDSVLRLENPRAAIAEYFVDRTSKKTCFLAFCFQPIGELNDPARVRSYRVISM
jgi:hypothetical protein